MASTASSVSGKRMSAVDPDVDEKLPDVNKKLDDTRAAPETSVAAPDGETQPTETAENKGEDEHEYITGFRLFTVMAAITLCVFLFLLDTAIIATAIPFITSQFNSLEDVGWYGAAYQLASAALQPLSGKIYSNFSNKWCFIAFFGIFELGSLICGVATSSKMLIVGRAVAGMGSSGIQNGGITIIAAAAPLERRPVLIGTLIGFCQLGVVFGPLIGGALTEYTTWRWCFYLNLPCGAVVALLLLFVRIPEAVTKPPPREVLKTLHKKLDLIGFVIFSGFTIQLLLVLQWGGNSYAWNSATIIGLFCGAGVTFFVFAAWDWYKGDEAMIPLGLMRQRIVWTSCVSYGFTAAGLFSSVYYLPIYFQSVKGATPTLSGVYLLPSIISQLILAVVTGKLVGVFGYYLPFMVGCTVLSSIAYGLLSLFAPGTSTGDWIGFQIILGVGRGMGLQMPLIAVQALIAPKDVPITNALVVFSGTFLGALYLSFSDTIFTNSLRTQLPIDAPGVDAGRVILAGATGFRSFVSGDQLQGVLQAYSTSIDRVFYFVAAFAALSVFFASGMGWRDIRKKEKKEGAGDKA